MSKKISQRLSQRSQRSQRLSQRSQRSQRLSQRSQRKGLGVFSGLERV